MRTILLAISFALLAGCYSRRSDPLTGPMMLSAREQQGQVVFYKHCNECHPQGEGGLGPPLNEKPLPRLAIHTQVRHALPPMPKFDESVMSDDDLQAMLDFVHALHVHE